MTVLEVIQRSAEFLDKKGVESPRLHAELLLAHVLQIPRLKLYLDFERKLEEKQIETLRELVRRRGQREPLQHILGTANFCGLELKVNRHVLVPRPETESLAERAWQFLSTLDPQPSTVLDFGTGSGCLAIAIAVRCPQAQVHALDVSAEALATARENASHHPAGKSITFHQGDGFAALPADLRFDLIVSNPPYIPSGEIETLQPEVRDFDPRGALDGGADGLDFYRRLANEAAAHLTSRGKMMLEFGDGQAEAIQELFRARAWTVEAVESDLSQRPRLLIARPASS